MALPRIKINYLNGLLGTVTESEDGLLALVTNGTAVTDKFALEKAYTIYRYDGLTDLGITADNNPAMEKMVREFYMEAEEGTKVIIVAYANTETMSTLCDVATGKLKSLLISLSGKVRGVILGRDPAVDYTPTVTDGLDADVFTALPKALALADYCANTLFAPIFVLLEGRNYTSASTLKDISTEPDKKAMIYIGDTVSASEGASIGVIAGRIASIPVQRSIARVKDGAINVAAMYLGSKLVENAIDDVTTIHDKGYVTARTFVGKTGYFFTDDRMVCVSTDDYAHLANRRVLDKAFRIAYLTMIEELNDEIQINSDGTMQHGIVKSWEAKVETAIDSNMTVNGELSADATTGRGCTCFIDSSQDVLTAGKVEMSLKVRPFGYARNIDINLGFQVTSA